jgi:two-component system chemotaxis response regulator CheB
MEIQKSSAKKEPNAKRAIRVLVVDDSPLFRQMISTLFHRFPQIEIVGLAEDGEKAMKSVVDHKPDVVLLDLEMPHVDGFTFLRWLMAYFPTPVLVISSRSDGYSVFRALELGASDFFAKPSYNQTLSEHSVELVSKIEVLSKISKEKLSKKYADAAAVHQSVPPPVPPPRSKKPISRLLAIGASTGGPPALYKIITHLPEDIPAAIVISQHMPAGFTKSFSERLNKSSNVPVLEAVGGEQLENGRVYVAPGGYHLLFEQRDSKVYTVLKEKTDEDRYVPSIDLMMTSAAQIFGRQIYGIILTGMGNDGKMGMKVIKEKGGTTLAESEETAVVYGMPREAVLAGVVDKSLPLDQIGDEILKHYGLTRQK